MSLLSHLDHAPRDPILGLTEAFNADDRADKVNLGVGVYQTEEGVVPLLDCVATVDQRIIAAAKPYGYLPIDGLKAYDRAVADLVLGDSVERDRVAVVQSLGGTGALKVAADFLQLVGPEATVLISDPSWENHRAIFTRAGFTVETYPYFDAATNGVDIEGMLSALLSAEAGTIVVLHACCHNPTGYDLTPDQWDRVLAVVAERGLVPLLDMAYQGFGHGLAADGAAVGKFARAGITCLISTSFSKTFSLYGERVGALTVVCADAEEAATALSQLKIVVRTTYSNPPTHGATVVATVLDDPELRQQWEGELAGMRERIQRMRVRLREGLKAATGVDLAHITTQNGMFSYSGLSKEQMIALRTEHAVYGLDSGRICVAALNERNLPTVIAAIGAVL
ncbi:MAG: aspartate/tyrosine/aromatic aminotransferase [Propionibacteriales bacterium]|nr:aspartate/tyrosine/aromatic aminotransferase [Propionibacteriales bacterium]